MCRTVLISGIVTIIIVISALWFNNVDNNLTEEDHQYIPLYLKDISQISFNESFEEEILFIEKVQDSVLNIASIDKGIPFNQKREPKELYEAKAGFCFDRSRVIEKILRSKGFETRHIFIYSLKETGSSVKSFFTPGIASHAVTEVLTKKGWLVVGSNNRWISIDVDGNPRSMEDLRLNSENKKEIQWKNNPSSVYSDLAPYTYIYGLYSRHGEFYPPYNFIPDVNYSEFVDNVF